MFIEPAAYHQSDIFEKELTQLFAERLFVGTTQDFSESDAYHSMGVGRKQITARRTPEGVRAFSNVCLHRSNLIDPPGFGRRQFRCGFHGWSYDGAGAVSNTPFTDINCVSNRALIEYPTSEASGFVFAGLNGKVPDVALVPRVFDETGIVAGEAYHRETLVHDCNWKLLVENILESYHLNFVHRDTFLKSGFNSASVHEWKSEAYVNTASIMPKEETSKLSTIRRLARDATHSYKHGYVFPNLFTSNTNDLIGFVSCLYPIAPTRTIMSWQLFEQPVMLKLAVAVREHMREEAIHFARTTLAEDKEMVEACQAGVSSDTASVQLQPIEGRVIDFHHYYRERMSRV